MLSWFEHVWNLSAWVRAAIVAVGIVLGVWFINTIARWIDNRIRYRQMVAEAVLERQEQQRLNEERRQRIAERVRTPRKPRKKPEPPPPPAPPPPVVAVTAWDRILRDDEDEQESPPCPTTVMHEMASPAPTRPRPKPRPPRKLKA